MLTLKWVLILKLKRSTKTNWNNLDKIILENVNAYIHIYIYIYIEGANTVGIFSIDRDKTFLLIFVKVSLNDIKIHENYILMIIKEIISNHWISI